MGRISGALVALILGQSIALAQTPTGLIGVEGDGAYHEYSPIVAVGAGLPDQAGQSGNCLKTDGNAPSWGGCGSGGGSVTYSTTVTGVGGNSTAGAANTVSRGDHLHGADARTATNATNIQVNKNDIGALSTIVNKLPSPAAAIKDQAVIISSDGSAFTTEDTSDLVLSGLPALTSQGGKVLTVNTAADGLEWTDKGGGGSTGGGGEWTQITTATIASNAPNVDQTERRYALFTGKWQEYLTLLKSGYLFALTIQINDVTGPSPLTGTSYLKVDATATGPNTFYRLHGSGYTFEMNAWLTNSGDDLEVYLKTPTGNKDVKNNDITLWYLNPGGGGGGGDTPSEISYAGAASDITYKSTEAPGTANTVSRGDHIHGFGVNAANYSPIKPDGDGNPGSDENNLSKGDHKHPLPDAAPLVLKGLPPLADQAGKVLTVNSLNNAVIWQDSTPGPVSETAPLEYQINTIASVKGTGGSVVNSYTFDMTVAGSAAMATFLKQTTPRWIRLSLLITGSGGSLSYSPAYLLIGDQCTDTSFGGLKSERRFAIPAGSTGSTNVGAAGNATLTYTRRFSTSEGVCKVSGLDVTVTNLNNGPSSMTMTISAINIIGTGGGIFPKPGGSGNANKVLVVDTAGDAYAIGSTLPKGGNETPSTVSGVSGNPGNASTYSRSNHSHKQLFSAVSPKKSGTANHGGSALASRGDHVHPQELPAVAENAGKILKVNSGADGVEWVDEPTIDPDLKMQAIRASAYNQIRTEWGATGTGGDVIFNSNRFRALPIKIPTGLETTGNTDTAIKPAYFSVGWTNTHGVTFHYEYFTTVRHLQQLGACTEGATIANCAGNEQFDQGDWRLSKTSDGFIMLAAPTTLTTKYTVTVTTNLGIGPVVYGPVSNTWQKWQNASGVWDKSNGVGMISSANAKRLWEWLKTGMLSAVNINTEVTRGSGASERQSFSGCTIKMATGTFLPVDTMHVFSCRATIVNLATWGVQFTLSNFGKQVGGNTVWTNVYLHDFNSDNQANVAVTIEGIR